MFFLQEFPLNHDEITVFDNAPREPMTFRIKSDLMKKLEDLTPQILSTDSRSYQDNEFPMTLSELRQKRREAAKLRVQESYRIAKARHMNKIKSKKYHRLQKREKLKKQMKEFEELQKTDPEAALKRLEILDHSRVEERANLRHKNTGTWAKNLQIRAKYDKDVRAELSQQLAISRELTRKVNLDDDSSDQDDDFEIELDNEVRGSDSHSMNPWMKQKSAASVENEVEKYFSGYKKYWETRNANDKDLDDYLVEMKEEKVSISSDTLSESESDSGQVGDWFVENVTSDDAHLTRNSKNSVKFSIPDKNIKKSVEQLFDDAEGDLLVKKKITKIMKKKKLEKINNATDEMITSYSTDLNFINTGNRPVIDDELLGDSEVFTVSDQFNTIKQLAKGSIKIAAENSEVTRIDPNKFIMVKPKYIQSALPDIINPGDDLNDDESSLASNKRMTIAEAFDEDDIVADFKREKAEEKKKDEVEDIDMTIPGWGSWGGKGIIKRSNNRFILKLPKDLPRSDDNKDRVIINEIGNQSMKTHMVSQLPFPFTSVKDYESSIRAPIGTTFVPETAHRLLTKPAIKTKIGKIIEPMDKTSLTQKNDIKVFKSKTDLLLEKLKK